MGNTPSLPNQFFEQTTINLQQWKEVRTIKQTYFQNNITQKCYQLHILPKTQNNQELIQERAQIIGENIPKIISLGSFEQKLYLAVETTDETLKQFLKHYQYDKVLILELYHQALKVFNQLKNNYGCFFITEQMISASKTGKILGWFNKDYLKIKPQYPLPQNIGEENMIWSINKIFDSFINSQLHEMKSETFIQSIQRCSYLLSTTSSIKNYRQRAISDKNYGKTSLELKLKTSIYQIMPMTTQIRSSYPINFDQEQCIENYGNISKRNSIKTKDSVEVYQSKLSQFKQPNNHQHTRSALKLLQNGSGQSIQSIQSLGDLGSPKKIGLKIKEKCYIPQQTKRNHYIEDSEDSDKQSLPLIFSTQAKSNEEFSDLTIDQNKHMLLNISSSEHSQSYQKTISIDKQQLIENFNNLLYGQGIEECNSPLRRQLEQDLRNIFSSGLLY